MDLVTSFNRINVTDKKKMQDLSLHVPTRTMYLCSAQLKVKLMRSLNSNTYMYIRVILLQKKRLSKWNVIH